MSDLTPGIGVVGVSVVVPAFGSTSSLEALVRRVHAALPGREHEILLVDDGSAAATWAAIVALAATDRTVHGIRLGRNAGQHAALLAGLRSARHPLTVTIDDDLQNPPEEIPRLLEALESEHLDLVYGAPREVAAPAWRRAGGRAVRRWLSRLTGLDLRHLSSFRAFRTRLREAAEAASGPRVVLDAVLQWGTGRVGHVEVRHDPRRDGRSGYGFRRLVGFALDMLTGYSTRPLRATTWIGFSSAAFGLLILIYVVGRYLLLGTSVAGFPFLASTVAILSGAQLIALGVMGEYLARIHLRSLGQPTYTIAERTTDRRTPSDDAPSADR